MSSFVKEFVKIEDRTTLDDAIDALMALRCALPEGANASPPTPRWPVESRIVAG
jgi:hypothetical protein